MKAKICDRCGCTYTSNSKHQTHGRIKGLYIGGIAYTDYDHHTDAVSDLCDDCIDDLIIFMSKRPQRTEQ